MIKLEYKGTQYVLEYDRDSVTILEKLGFSLEKYSEQPMNMMPLVFKGAFHKNHKFVKQTEIENIFNAIKNRDKLMSELLKMISDSYESLMNNDEGNLDWEIV